METYFQSGGRNYIRKDPSAVLDYSFDWSEWLGEDTIQSAVCTVDDGVTKENEANSTTAVTVWVSGGTSGSDYAVRCTITTVAGRTDERTIYLRVRER